MRNKGYLIQGRLSLKVFTLADGRKRRLSWQGKVGLEALEREAVKAVRVAKGKRVGKDFLKKDFID